MNRMLILASSTLALVLGSFYLTTRAESQPTAKGIVTLQPTTPGTPQTGHSNISGTSQAGQFVGGGAGLTGLNASNIASGTLADARLSSNVARLNVVQGFTGAMECAEEGRHSRPVCSGLGLVLVGGKVAQA